MRATCLWISKWTSPILLEASFRFDSPSRNTGSLIGLQGTVHLQSLQANEAGNCETIYDVFLTRHGLSLPPTGWSVSAVSRSALSPPRAPCSVRATGPLLIGPRGQGRGPLLVQVHSPPPLSVSLRPGPTALSEPGATAGTLHDQDPNSV